MAKTLLVFAAVAGAVAVALGAMAAHALRELLPPATLNIFETAVRFQFYHVFALLACGLLCIRKETKTIRLAGWCFMTGILLFCGSLYLLSYLQFKNAVISPAVGILTPVGGLFFMAGWIALAFSIPRITQA